MITRQSINDVKTIEELHRWYADVTLRISLIRDHDVGINQQLGDHTVTHIYRPQLDSTVKFRFDSKMKELKSNV